MNSLLPVNLQQPFNQVFNNPVGDFIDGQRDCKEGVPHQAGKSEEYTRGYGVQYEFEQQKTAEY